jgi:TolB-like protein
VAETTTAILRDEPPPLANSGHVAPVELDRLIIRCLEKTPEQRIQSARDVAYALRDIMTDTLSRPSQYAQISGRGHTIDSIAVLPLENLSGDPDQEYFVDGMMDALIANLAKISALRVISRTSAMRYKGTDKPLPEIARALNVAAVVEGSVLRAGEQVRITVQLIEASTDQHLWAESYEGNLRDILGLQRDVAQSIAHEIKVKLTPQEQAHLAIARPVNGAAHEAQG